ncbi:MAG: hypothetical protein WKF84_25900 [Pyrinomonadaceae bacterium]
MIKNSTSKLAPLSIAFSVGGLLLFFFFVRKAGLSQVLDGLRSLGLGLSGHSRPLGSAARSAHILLDALLRGALPRKLS